MKEKLNTLHQRLTQTVLGSEEPAYLILVALLARGHVLIQGAPGIGKTSLAKTLAQSITGSFKRLQFTPDLLPADILGYSMYHQGTGQFQFIEGPVFSNILLADEINRTSPRIQSALLECMNEGQVSIDGVTRPLQKPFMVLATQNNRYASGTFPLPEPQLDRFLVAINMRLPDMETQTDILMLHAKDNPDRDRSPILTSEELSALQSEASNVTVSENVCRYIAHLCEAARHHKSLGNGLSARASIALMRAAQAVAFLENHAAVHPDDVKRIAIPVFQHRLSGRDQGSAKGTRVALEDVLLNTPVA
ncbi:MAG: MoxR-like ATPase [Verrucomicrobiales bacterium]